MEFNPLQATSGHHAADAYCQYPISVKWVEVLILFAIQ